MNRFSKSGSQQTLILLHVLHMRISATTTTIIIKSIIFATHISVLPIRFVRFCVRFMKTIMHNIRAFHVHIVQDYYIRIQLNGQSETKPLSTIIPLTTHPNNPSKIAVCRNCKSHPNTRINHRLAPIPACITDVPYAKRKYLSPIFLHTSLGRSVGANPFVEYRSLTGQMGYSKNRRALTLYSGMLGAFLQQSDLSEPNNRWYHPSLHYACDRK